MKMQYQQIKSQYSDCLLFFRLGDFYEMFDEDARVASRELDLALTTRDRSVSDPEQRTPMCGVPYHSSQTYIARLIAKGYKVAICEQIEDPATAKGLVKRDVIRIITPGTVTDASMLEEGKSNYLGAVYCEAGKCAAAFCDISTGEFCAAAFTGDGISHVLNELGRFAPRELIMNKGAAETQTIPDFARKKLGCLLEMGGDDYEYMACAARVCEQFGLSSVDEAGLGDTPEAVSAAGALLRYISETQKTDMAHIRRIDLFTGGKYMELDWATRRSLELTESLRQFFASVAHEQKAEQLPFVPRKGDICHAAGLIRLICITHHFIGQKALILGVCSKHYLVLHLMHILKKSEHRLCRRAETRRKAACRELCHSALTHYIERGRNDLFTRKFRFRRHGYSSFISQRMLRNVCCHYTTFTHFVNVNRQLIDNEGASCKMVIRR